MERFDIIRWIRDTVGLSAATQMDIALSIVVILTLWLSRRVLLRAVESRNDDVQSRYRWRKITAYVAFFVGALVIGRLWFHGFASISTMVGLISAGIAIALRDPLVNLAGWLFILWRQPFSVGDRVEVGAEVAGDVIDQRLFAFTLMEIGNWVHEDQSTGRVVHVPNGRVFTETVANYSKGFQYIWEEIPVLVTFESNWRKAKQILARIVEHHAEHLSAQAEQRVQEVSRRFMIFYSKLTPIVYTSVEDCGVLLTLRYLTEPQRRRGRKQAVWEDILDAFAECDDIDFAYPTQRMYFNLREGKRGTVKGAGDSFATPPDPSDGFLD